MKRCSQCDFVYEDDQDHCDMDGRELVHDPRPLPLPENAAPPLAGPPAKLRWRKYAVLPVAGIILGVILFSVYYVSTHRAAPQNTNHSSVPVTAGPQSAPALVLAAPVAPPTPTPNPSPVPKVKATNRAAPKTTNSSAPVLRPTPRPFPSPTPKPVETKIKPERANNKKESKLGSILKKTGRMLKKPFKL